MADLTDFGLRVLLVAAGLYAALVASRLVARTSIPPAAIFLAAAAVASDLWPGLALSIATVEKIGTVALVVILFDGGASIGWPRFRRAALPIASLGVLGTFATAGLVAAFAHAAFGLHWITAGLLGAAIAPTDPAVMFSVLGNHDVEGRTGTILEGESGANDPVGIALMIGLIELATKHGSFWIVVRIFAEQMSIGLAIGLAGGIAGRLVAEHVSLPSTGLHTVRSLALSGVVYGVAAVAHGSGFLAVFVAGILMGGVRSSYRREAEAFMEGLATLAEIAVFIALGLTVELSHIGASRAFEGVAAAAFLALVARPVVVGALLVPASLRRGERLFVMWGGLKGAVPILLAAFAVGRHVDDAQRLYDLVFVVVLLSVVIQGGTIARAARRFGVELGRDDRPAPTPPESRVTT
jgi:cell volume regulation protein A